MKIKDILYAYIWNFQIFYFYRYLDLDLPLKDVVILADDLEIGNYFDECLKNNVSPLHVANWLIGDITSYCKLQKINFNEIKMTPAALSEMISLIDSSVISGKIGKKILPSLLNGIKL